jgi:hypothetical protein
MSGITASRGLGSTGSGPVPADTGRVADDPHALDATMHAMQSAVNLDRVMCEIQARIRRARESLPGSALDCFSYPRDLAKVNDVMAGVEAAAFSQLIRFTKLRLSACLTLYA